MKIKFKYYLVIILAVVPFIVFASTIKYLPDNVALHYNIAGEADRWGSKYEEIIIPLIIIVLALLLVFIARYYGRKKEEYNNEKVLLNVSIYIICFLNVIYYYLLYCAFKNTDQSLAKENDVMQVVLIILGLLLIAMGNIMPKAKNNSVFGLRTKWSLKNEQTWFKSQRIGAICLITAGIIMIIINIIAAGMIGTIVSFTVIIIATVVSVLASYKYYLMYGK